MNINELLLPEGQSIHTFKKGDIIIRLKRGTKTIKHLNANLGVIHEIEVENERMDYREVPGKLIGIYNNLIYIKSLAKFRESIDALPIEDFSEHWALFQIPDGLTLEDCL